MSNNINKYCVNAAYFIRTPNGSFTSSIDVPKRLLKNKKNFNFYINGQELGVIDELYYGDNTIHEKYRKNVIETENDLTLLKIVQESFIIRDIEKDMSLVKDHIPSLALCNETLFNKIIEKIEKKAKEYFYTENIEYGFNQSLMSRINSIYPIVHYIEPYIKTVYRDEQASKKYAESPCPVPNIFNKDIKFIVKAKYFIEIVFEIDDKNLNVLKLDSDFINNVWKKVNHDYTNNIEKLLETNYLPMTS